MHYPSHRLSIFGQIEQETVRGPYQNGFRCYKNIIIVKDTNGGLLNPAVQNLKNKMIIYSLHNIFRQNQK